MIDGPPLVSLTAHAKSKFLVRDPRPVMFTMLGQARTLLLFLVLAPTDAGNCQSNGCSQRAGTYCSLGDVYNECYYCPQGKWSSNPAPGASFVYTGSSCANCYPGCTCPQESTNGCQIDNFGDSRRRRTFYAAPTPPTYGSSRRRRTFYARRHPLLVIRGAGHRRPAPRAAARRRALPRARLVGRTRLGQSK
jgi:hypothetical protein